MSKDIDVQETLLSIIRKMSLLVVACPWEDQAMCLWTGTRSHGEILTPEETLIYKSATGMYDKEETPGD
jgi:hypothetical protein